jgi:hypothetical protein
MENVGMIKAFENDRMSRCEMHYVGTRRKMRLQRIIEKAGWKKAESTKNANNAS